MLGVDAEYFTVEKDLAIPVLEFFGKAKDTQGVFKDIASDIQPNGYNSYEINLGDAKLTEDGLPFEVPIAPDDDVDALVERLAKGIRKGWEIADENGYKMSASPLVYFKEKYLEYRPELRVLGCSPDMCVYLLQEGACKPKQVARKTPWRTGGFHVHFSVELDNPESLVTACDCLLGLSDVLLEHSALGKQRREMYGAAGRFRLQDWGVEYRTPSSVVSISPEVTTAFLNAAKVLHRAVENGLDGVELVSELGFREVVKAINNVDLRTAAPLWEKVVNKLPFDGADLVYNIGAMGGAEKYYSGYIMESWK